MQNCLFQCVNQTLSSRRSVQMLCANVFGQSDCCRPWRCYWLRPIVCWLWAQTGECLHSGWKTRIGKALFAFQQHFSTACQHDVSLPRRGRRKRKRRSRWRRSRRRRRKRKKNPTVGKFARKTGGGSLLERLRDLGVWRLVPLEICNSQMWDLVVQEGACVLVEQCFEPGVL